MQRHRCAVLGIGIGLGGHEKVPKILECEKKMPRGSTLSMQPSPRPTAEPARAPQDTSRTRMVRRSARGRRRINTPGASSTPRIFPGRESLVQNVNRETAAAAAIKQGKRGRRTRQVEAVGHSCRAVCASGNMGDQADWPSKLIQFGEDLLQATKARSPLGAA